MKSTVVFQGSRLQDLWLPQISDEEANRLSFIPSQPPLTLREKVHVRYKISWLCLHESSVSLSARRASHRLLQENGITDGVSAEVKQRFIRYRARVLYDGTNFSGSGWQFQRRHRTVQGELEDALSRKIQYPIRITGAGRTDAGVHARGQIIHFDVPEELAVHASRFQGDTAALEFCINRMLSNEVRIAEIEEARALCEGGFPWHAIACAKGKLYSYKIYVGPWMEPIERLYRHCVCRPCDLNKVSAALRLFEGRHDFTSFANKAVGVNYKGRSMERTISSAQLVDEGDGRYRLDFFLDGALYRMVRNIVGALLAVGCGNLELHNIEEILRAKDRRKAPKSAPAHGLCLEKVFYDQPSHPGSSLVVKPKQGKQATRDVPETAALE